MPVRLSSRYKHRAREKSKEVSKELVPDWAIAARTDVELFSQMVCGQGAAEVHRSWFPILITGASNECLNLIAGDNTNLLSFRGSAKTTWLRRIIAWAIGHNPHIQIGWVSYSESIAVKSSRVIKRILASPQYQQVFPHIRKGSRWGDIDWEIDKPFAQVSAFDSDITLAAIGATGAVTSNRFHLIVFDDLIKSSKAIANEDVREAMLLNIQEAIEPCLIPGGRMIDLGTRWREDDIHATYFTRENGWDVIEQSAIVTDDDGQERSTWEERFSLAMLQKLRAAKPIVFLMQYQNQLPDLHTERPVRPEFIQYGEPPLCHSLVLGVDLAAGEDEVDDYTALVLCGKAPDGKYYVLYTDQFRASGNVAKIRRIMQLRKKYRNFRVIAEKNAYQKSFEGDWRDYCNRYGVKDIVCETVAAVDDKIIRLESVSGIFENGFVVFNKNHGMQALVNQLLLLDRDHDDLMDACVYALSKLQKRTRRPISSA